MRLLIVIVNYKVAHLTIDCLRSLAPEVKTLPGVRVAVCENGTGDDSAERISRAIADNGWGDWATLTAIHPNLGFTGGNNAIIRPAMSWPDAPELFHLLNADTIVRPGAIAALLDFMDRRPDVGIAGSRLENPDGSVQTSTFRFITARTEFESGLRLGLFTRLAPHWHVAMPIPSGEAPAEWVCGASLVVRRRVLEQIGLLDEDLYTYFDDPDICLRALRAGWPTWYVPSSRVVHLVGQTTGVSRAATLEREAPPPRPKRRPSYWFQARRHYFLKNFGPWHTLVADAAWLIGFSLWRVRRILQRKHDPDPHHMLWDSLRHSVFMTGFAHRPVTNPALAASEGQ